MIATRRGLAILAALVLVLTGVLVVDVLREAPGPLDRSLVPGLVVGDVTRLRWEHTGGAEAAQRELVELVRDGEGWRLVAPVEGDANERTVDEVLAALRAARWQRRAEVSAAGTSTSTLVIGAADGTERVLGFGQALAGTEQVWIVTGGRALLVDRWIAGALSPSPLDLVVRRPFESAGQAPAIELRDALGRVRLEGSPRRLVSPSEVLVDPAIVSELEDALSALELVELVTAPPSGDALVLEVGAVRGVLGGACASGGVALGASTAGGCVTREAAEAVRAAVERLRQPVFAIVDRRPAPLDPVAITLPDGELLDLAKQPRIGERAADPVRVAELLAVLAAPAEVVAFPAQAAAPAPRRMTIAERHGTTLELELVAPRIVRRAGEPVALRLTAAAWEVLTRPGRALREPTLWLEDPLAVTTLTIGEVVYMRGAVIGEWVLASSTGGAPAPVATSVARRLEALATTLASPRSLGDAPAFNPTLDVTMTVAHPTGDATVVVLSLGRKTGGACPARVAGEGVLLDASVCDAAHALAR